MDQADNLRERAAADFRAARTRYALYEKFYRSLSSDARAYLRDESRQYKRSLEEIRSLILPAVSKTCPVCRNQCCKLYTPERSIYIAGTVGGFHLNDYLLARCDETWPDPRYENAENNLCPFWDGGCILPGHCRSYLCIQYFCDDLQKNLAMEAVTESLGRLKTILEAFAIGKCMS